MNSVFKHEIVGAAVVLRCRTINQKVSHFISFVVSFNGVGAHERLVSTLATNSI
jgi:hypothetical protein